jgi:hypothetical protein
LAGLSGLFGLSGLSGLSGLVVGLVIGHASSIRAGWGGSVTSATCVPYASVCHPISVAWRARAGQFLDELALARLRFMMLLEDSGDTAVLAPLDDSGSLWKPWKEKENGFARLLSQGFRIG